MTIEEMIDATNVTDIPYMPLITVAVIVVLLVFSASIGGAVIWMFRERKDERGKDNEKN